jgi:NAD(P)H-nitrite reductase large subunit
MAPMAKRDLSNTQKMVIVGGGVAGLNCAETLRQSNYTGEITVISDEKRHPYDRTLLSKVLAGGDVDKLGLRESGFYNENDIDYHLGYRVQTIDKNNKSLTLTDGSKMNYDKLLLATGSRARKVKNEGADLPGVFYLRQGDDQLAIKEAAKNANNIVVIGGGFIGAEATANLAKTYPGKVSLVMDTHNPLETYFGYDVSSMFLNEH